MKDRNFDDLAEKFERKVYGSLKGDIRQAVIWRDLCQTIPSVTNGCLRVLDIGGGLGQMSVRLAKLGHDVTYNDISSTMLSKAKARAASEGVGSRITFYQCPYQLLVNENLGDFDLVLCHAIVEWLGKPDELINHLMQFKSAEGLISLTFYNHNALVYRNLIRGNFNLLTTEFTADPGSLTPHSPFKPEQIEQWSAQQGLSVLLSSGIRVFHDYITTPRG
ncbi:MAG: methyltransferase domain-containing protein, partial [Porticoccaceae bacterium]|nr:methyltransferase domain-containing protein [Porticoccaceae bacterium]